MSSSFALTNTNLILKAQYVEFKDKFNILFLKM